MQMLFCFAHEWPSGHAFGGLCQLRQRAARTLYDFLPYDARHYQDGQFIRLLDAYGIDRIGSQ
jgi:hypothetical protein